MIDSKVIKEMTEALKLANSGTKPYDTTAEVLRVEEGIAWVHIPGGADETPVQMSINARPGDTVRVRVAGGQAWLVGNDTAPPTDDTKALEAEKAAKNAKTEAIKMVTDLDESLAQDEIMRRITNNFEWDGIYVDEQTGNYYINASYIHAGAISADMISGGSMSANLIKGGTLKVGGTAGGAGGNGVIDIYNSSNTRVGRWNASGLTVGSNNEFQVDMNGKITAKSADLTGSITLSNHSSTVWLDVVVSGSPDGSLGPGMRVYYCPPNDTNIFWGPSLTLTKLSSPDWLFQGKHGKIYDDGNLYLNNNKRLYGKDNSAAQAATYIPLIYLNGNNNIILGTNDSGAFGNMNFYVPSGSKFNFNSDIGMASGATVDGVDVSLLAPSSVSSVNSSAAVSLTNATDTDLINTGSLAAGTYIIKATASFANNATGRRALFLSTSSGGSAVNRYARVVAPPASGDATRMQLTYLCTISSATTFYLRGYQNSGAALDVSECGFQILKIHA